MKFLLQFAAVLVGSLALQLFLPWFVVVIVALIAGFFLSTESGFKNFLAGFLGVLILWVATAMIMNSGADGLIAERLGKQFGVPASGFVLPLISGLIGGIAGGLGSLTGGALKSFFKPAEG